MPQMLNFPLRPFASSAVKNKRTRRKGPVFFSGFSFPDTGGPVVSNQTHRPAALYALHAPSGGKARRAIFKCSTRLYPVSYGNKIDNSALRIED